jgi:hypothetical protein
VQGSEAAAQVGTNRRGQVCGPNLQHNKKEREEKDAGKAVIADDGGCTVHDYESSETEEGSENYVREHALYDKAMKIYCDLQSEAAYKDDYDWPTLAA